MNQQYKKLPWGTIIPVFLVIGGLYALYPSGDTGGNGGDVVMALFYAIGIVVGLGILILCWFLFRPKWKGKEKAEKNDTAVKKVSPSKTPTKESNAGLNITIMLACLVTSGFLAFSGMRPYQDVIPVPPDGMLYIPLYGLALAASFGGFITSLLSLYDEKDKSALFFPVALLLGLGFLGYGMIHDWFVPSLSDPLSNFWSALILAFATYCAIAIATKNDTAKVISAIVIITVWLPQYPAFRYFIHSLF